MFSDFFIFFRDNHKIHNRKTGQKSVEIVVNLLGRFYFFGLFFVLAFFGCMENRLLAISQPNFSISFFAILAFGYLAPLVPILGGIDPPTHFSESKKGQFENS